jgi:hypothetical protein
MHPLNTLIESQRHQVRRQSGNTTRPRRRSSTEEAAIVAQSKSERRSLSLVFASTLLSLLFVAYLATVLV